MSPATSKKPVEDETNHETKLFVLDTNVLLHDPTSLFRFEEHDICLPMFVLEELDNKKKGMTEVARNARQASRFLDEIVSDAPHKVVEDTDLLYTGVLPLPDDFWDRHSKDMKSWQKEGHTYYQIQGPLCGAFFVNQFVYLENDTSPFYAVVMEQDAQTALLRTLTDYTHSKNNVWGITARNGAPNFVLNLLLNPEIDFVTLL